MARTEGRSFRYQKRSKEDVKERANAQGGGFDRFIKPAYKTYKVRDGKNLIRVLPPTWGDAKHYGYDIYVNYGIGVDEQSYLSLSRMLSKPDPLAEARRQAEREGNSDLAKQLNPTQRVLMWVIDRLDEDEGPMLWAAPFTVDKGFATISFDEDTHEVVYIDDPEEGCDVRFYREGQGLKTKYDGAKMKLLKPSPLHEDDVVKKEWLDYVQANPIPDCLQYYDYGHISNVFDGQSSKPEKDEDDDGDAPLPKVVPKQRPRPQLEDEPVEVRPKTTGKRPVVEVNDDDDSDEDTPTPRRGAESIRDRLSRRRGAAQQVDEDDEIPF